jgi:UDP-N-acetylglucosamine 3-dehydrogenase
MTKAAVIGVGAIGRNHARVYNELSDVELVAVCDTSEETAANVGQWLNIPHETNYLHMLDTYKPDLVSISVPTMYHFEVAAAVIERGVHVLVEKPITATEEEGRKLIQLAADAGVKLTVGHIERFNPAVIELKKRIDAGDIGDVFRVQSRRMGPFPARIRDVGVTIDLASHDLDIVRYIMDTDITRVYAETAQNIATDREDTMDCVLRCTNGVVGTLNINWVTPTKIRELAVTGTKGMFVVNYLTQELFFYENAVASSNWQQLSVLSGVSEGTVTKPVISRHEPLKAELDYFAGAVRDNTAPLISGEDGLKALIAAQALVKSGQTQQVIKLT